MPKPKFLKKMIPKRNKQQTQVIARHLSKIDDHDPDFHSAHKPYSSLKVDTTYALSPSTQDNSSFQTIDSSCLPVETIDDKEEPLRCNLSMLTDPWNSLSYDGAKPIEESPTAITSESPELQSRLTANTPLDPSLLIDFGEIFARVSPHTLLSKDWQLMTWVQYGPYTLHLFKSSQDYWDWKHYSFSGSVTSEEKRQGFVKKTIDFAHELAKTGIQGYTFGNVVPKSYVNVGSATPL